MENITPVHADTAALPKNGHSKTTHLSANSTLFWRVFVPIFGTVFLGALASVFWFTPADELYLRTMSITSVRLIVTLLFVSWLLLVYRTVLRLLRVDANDVHLYVTNYWTTVRYPWIDVERIETVRRLGRRIVHIYLKAPGRFGAKISFLPGSQFTLWLEENRKNNFLKAN